jgi:hypothetical protein
LPAKLTDVCSEGGSGFFTSGFDPGWSGDVIPLALAQCSERVAGAATGDVDKSSVAVFFRDHCERW